MLQDLEKLDEELERIKSQLGNASASASSQGLLKKLEKNMADTKVAPLHRHPQRGRTVILVTAETVMTGCC